MKSRDAVCFGLGDGDEHLITNKDTGEINRMRDDGINYYQDLLVIPPDKVEQFCAELNALHGGNADKNGGTPSPAISPSPLPRPAP